LLKVLLMGHLAQVGLALATSVGAWLNLSLLAWFARRQGFIVSGAAIGKPTAMLIVAGVLLALGLFGGQSVFAGVVAKLPFFREETLLAILLVLGAITYAGLVLILLGKTWLNGLLRDVATAADATAPAKMPPDPTQVTALPDADPPPPSS
jgi:putative peptidoglycan lipid II flippase